MRFVLKPAYANIRPLEKGYHKTIKQKEINVDQLGLICSVNSMFIHLTRTAAGEYTIQHAFHVSVLAEAATAGTSWTTCCLAWSSTPTI